MDLDGKLGEAQKLIELKVKDIGSKSKEYDRYRKVYKGWENEEVKDNIYLIFRRAYEGQYPKSLYVGKTRQSIYKRLSNHYNEVLSRLRGEKEWDIKHRWLYELIKDEELEIILLNKVQRSEIYYYEKEWIKYLFKCNFNMINKNNSYKIKHKVGKI